MSDRLLTRAALFAGRAKRGAPNSAGDSHQLVGELCQGTEGFLGNLVHPRRIRSGLSRHDPSIPNGRPRSIQAWLFLDYFSRFFLGRASARTENSGALTSRRYRVAGDAGVAGARDAGSGDPAYSGMGWLYTLGWILGEPLRGSGAAAWPEIELWIGPLALKGCGGTRNPGPLAQAGIRSGLWPCGISAGHNGVEMRSVQGGRQLGGGSAERRQ